MKRELMFKKSIIILSIIAVILTAILCIYPMSVVSAASGATFDDTALLDDLKGMTIDGKEFDVKNYPIDPYGSVELLTFAELCYSQYDNKRGDYGLYVYLNNPSLKQIDTNHVLNKVTIASAFNEKDVPSRYQKFDLRFCSSAENNQFLKYKVVDKENTLLTVVENYAKSHAGKRCYYVGSVELLTKGEFNATDYNVGRQFIYEGFAKGYGDSDNFPLFMTSLGMETIQTDVHYAFYRPDGETAEGNHTQHQLNSVYFSVPTSLIKKYGLLSAVHMEWYEYLTKEIFVLGNEAVYSKLAKYICRAISSYDSDVFYGLITNAYLISSPTGGNPLLGVHTDSGYYNYLDYNGNAVRDSISTLYYLFSSLGQSAKEFSISSEDLLNYIRNFQGSGEMINGKYYKDLFENYVGEGRQLGYNEISVKAEDKLSLTSYKLTQTWFQKLFGIKDYDLTVFDNISGIVSVSASDVVGTKESVCSKLYIDESNYSEFMSFYNDSKLSLEERTVFLLRYAVTDYTSVPTVISSSVKEFDHTYGHLVDANAYMARQTVFLDLDLIDVTFQDEEGIETVIPVVSNPIDAIANITPPINVADNNIIKLIKIILAILLVIVLLIVLWPILSPLLSILWSLIKLPFRSLSRMFKVINNKSKRGEHGNDE